MASLSGVSGSGAVCKPYSSGVSASSGRLVRRRGRGVLVRCRGFVWSKQDLQRLDQLSNKPRHQLVPDVLEQCHGAAPPRAPRHPLPAAPHPPPRAPLRAPPSMDAEPPPQVVPPPPQVAPPPSQVAPPPPHQHPAADVSPTALASAHAVGCEAPSRARVNRAAVAGIASTFIHLTL